MKSDRLFRKAAAKLLRRGASCLVLAALVRPVHAKEVFIEWKPINGAVEYAIEIERNGRPFVVKTVERSKWSGELPVGFYVYRLRAFDKIKRAGAWSSSRALVVMANAPKPESPRGGDSVALYGPEAAVTLRWRPVEGVSKYRLEVKKGEATVVDRVMTGTAVDIRGLPAGSYSWQISALIEAGDRAPASFAGRKWQGEIRSVDHFQVQRLRLERPVAVFPTGPIAPPKDGRLEFKWKAVEGAEAYELALYRRAPPRAPALEEPRGPLATRTVEETSVEVPLPDKGEFTWEVRALANRDSRKTVGAVGPKSVTDFRIDPAATFVDGSGYVALSTMVAPYTYKIVSPLTNVEGSFNSSSLTVRASGEYWRGSQWGMAAALENTMISVLGSNISRIGAELNAKYRIALSGTRYGWILMPKAGLESREYPETRPLSSRSQQFTLFKLRATGPMFGFDLRKQFSESFSLGVRVNYFLPFLLSGADGNLGGGANSRNMNVGVQGLHWLDKKWGIAAGVFLDSRSISYAATPASGGQSVNQEVYMDGTYFFGSIIYSFGR